MTIPPTHDDYAKALTVIELRNTTLEHHRQFREDHPDWRLWFAAYWRVHEYALIHPHTAA